MSDGLLSASGLSALDSEFQQKPIAVVGMGCRFPGGVTSPDEFWDLLSAGRDAITEIPSDRWRVAAFYDPDPARPGRTYARAGGFIPNLDKFDAQFFGISPREAACIDPQHRLLLETAWEALENAGLPADRLAGSNTGVFIGISTCDYGGIQTAVGERHSITAYTNLGLGMCIAANRISYLLDFHGPSFAVDTACSSSLVAVHLACQSLWSGECTLALVGGVNAILRPEGTIGFSKSAMLAPDGRCKSFDARADGYVRSEGAGVVVLKPLSQAIADKDPICAVIRGTATNQDGRTGGIALPNVEAQTAMLRRAYQRAGIDPGLVQYVEAHGTGTSVGDPIEVNALGRVLGQNRSAGHECLVGSVKSNIGHLEAASGIAGVIKAVLCITRGEIPANLHFTTSNPEIPFDAFQFRVPQVLTAWPNGSRHRLAGVNSFGFGGSNAHVILDTPPQVEDASSIEPVQGERGPALVPLSARTPESLDALALRYSEVLDGSGRPSAVSLRDLCYTASLRRTHHHHRLALVVHDEAALRDHLQAAAAGENRPGMARGRQMAKDLQRIGFVFSGMGQQWCAMGRELFETTTVFRDGIEECDALLRRHVEWSLVEELRRPEDRSRIQECDIAQPAVFALQVALAAVWRSWGIVPRAVVGHSVGEVAAAHVAGVLSLEDAVRLIVCRSRLQKRVAGQGAMLSVSLSAEEATRVIDDVGGQVSIAAINGPSDVTLSGDRDALQRIAISMEQRDVFRSFLQVDVPYHSSKMDPLEIELREALRDLAPRKASITMVSTATGTEVEGPELDADYWWRNVRHPVQFDRAIRALVDSGFRCFLELSAHPVLAYYVGRGLAAAQKDGTILPSLRRAEPERFVMLASLGRLYTAGFPVDWTRLQGGGGRFVTLPTYAWQRERFWNESERSARERLGATVHPLLGNRVDAAAPLWEGEWDRQRLPYFSDHRVQGTVMCPAAAFVELAFAASRECLGPLPYAVEDVTLQRALFLSGDRPVAVQLSLESDQSAFAISSHAAHSRESWVQHVTGRLRRFDAERAPALVDIGLIRERCGRHLLQAACYEEFAKLEIDYGPSFQGILQLWGGQREALGEIRIPADLSASADQYIVHPVLLDACLQVTLGTMALEGRGTSSSDGAYLPVRIESVRVYSPPRGVLYAHCRLDERRPTYSRASIDLLDAEGKTSIEIRGLLCRAIDHAIGESADRIGGQLYQYLWQRQPRAGQAVAVRSAQRLPGPHELVSRIQPAANELYERLDCKAIDEAVQPLMEEMAIAYILRAFKRLGCRFEPAHFFSAHELADTLNVSPEHARLLHRLLGVLTDAGELEQAGDKWAFGGEPPDVDVDDLWRRCWNRFPALVAELTLARRCGEHLADVLSGTIDPLGLIFPQGSLNTTEHLYQDSPAYRVYNTLVKYVVSSLLESTKDGEPLRILEVGGGTGGLTAYVLSAVGAADCAEYVFTDVTELLLRHAEQKFRDSPIAKYRTLDIDRDPVEQGFEPHSFDLILASDVVHATPDLRRTLKHIQQLLASDGLVVLLEGTHIQPWAILTFGLLKGWWLFSDSDLRGADPWLSRDAWMQLLRDTGFTEVDSPAYPTGEHGALHSVIVGRGPAVEAAPVDAAPPAAVASPGSWLILADRNDIGAAVANRLRSLGGLVTVASIGEVFDRLEDGAVQVRPGHLEDIERLVSSWLTDQVTRRGLIHLWSASPAPLEETTLDSLRSAQSEGVLTVLQLAQVLGRIEPEVMPRIWIATAGVETVAVHDRSGSVAHSPVWGLGRVIKNEYPDLRCTLIDLSAQPSAEEIDGLISELWSDDGEDEVVLRQTARYVPRLVCSPLEELQSKAPRAEVSDQPTGFGVEISTPGVLSTLGFRRQQRRTPSPREVEIDVRAAALNFKDVMVAMGLLPDEALEGGYTGKELGMECSGVVAAVGEDVHGVNVGDAVVTCAPGALRTRLTVDDSYLVQKPSGLSYEEATTIPIAFLTAHYSLNYLARMRPGERVLIHAAAGGVGLAAIQLAQRADAEVYATAGSPEKRELLHALGVRHVMDSRSLSFADDVMRMTDGRGVDIVLNSLAGVAIGKSLAVLKAYGRFVEIGKKDIYVNSRLELRPFRNNLSYFAVDLDRLCVDQPSVVQALLKEVMDGFASGMLHPLAHRAFQVSDISNAFRYMAQARHVGKVVVRMDDASVEPAPAAPRPLQLRSDATYVLTGGLGGFGLAVANWLVDKGARNLVLIGRRGASTPEAKSAVEALSQKGTTVVVEAVDVASEEQVVQMLTRIRESMPPLRGVLHAAMVLDDRLLNQLDGESLSTVMAPKVLGAWNLHRHTLDDPLDLFVCFSSFTSLFGNPGQGNYVAANAFLDALAHQRRARGLPALTVNWGVVADVGFVAQNAEIAEKLGHIGIKPMLVSKLLDILESLIGYEAVHVGVAQINWQEIANLPMVGMSPRFSHLVAATAREGGDTRRISVLATLQTVAPSDRHTFLVEHICDQLARVLGTTASKLDIEQPLLNMGLDSLMALEIGNQIQSDVGVKIPPMKFMEGLTISGLATLVIEGLAKANPETWRADAQQSARPSPSVAEREVPLEARVASLSNEQVDAMLTDLLAGDTEGGVART